MRLKNAAVGAVAILLALGVAACGSSGGSTEATQAQPLSKQQYKVFLVGVAKREAKAQMQVEQGLHAKTAIALSRALGSFSTAQVRASEELDSASPPADAKAANAALARAFLNSATVGERTAERIAEAGSIQQAMSELQSEKKAQEAGREIDAAITRLKQLGYTKGS